MLKTIKVKKQFDLPTLISHMWSKNDGVHKVIYGNQDQKVVFDESGGFYPSGYAYNPNTIFTAEVEEEMMEETVFANVVTLHSNGTIENTWDTSIKSRTHRFSTATEIHAVIGGKLQLIWEREEE